MTIHRLTSAGARTTRCSLNVPGAMLTSRNDTAFEDGDGQPERKCPECWPVESRLATLVPGTKVITAEVPVAPARPYPGQRFKAFVQATGKAAPKGAGELWIYVGHAVANRDGTVDLFLAAAPIGGVLQLRPEVA